MQRACDSCGDPYEAQTKRSRFCSDRCRVAQHYAKKSGKTPAPTATLSTAACPSVAGSADDEKIAPALRGEFEKLGVLGMYEARTALGLARQLDSGTIVGAPYTSLSKELDRRVDALRIKAEKPDDPAAAVKGRLQEKRLRLA